jgi:hypothetical protein
MNDARIAELLKQDAKDLATLKVNKTPSFFINGKPLKEFGPNGLRAQVENEIGSLYQCPPERCCVRPVCQAASSYLKVLRHI